MLPASTTATSPSQATCERQSRNICRGLNSRILRLVSVKQFALPISTFKFLPVVRRGVQRSALHPRILSLRAYYLTRCLPEGGNHVQPSRRSGAVRPKTIDVFSVLSGFLVSGAAYKEKISTVVK